MARKKKHSRLSPGPVCGIEPALHQRYSDGCWCVVCRDPAGKMEPQAFFCTDTDMDPAEIILNFAKRWEMEVTFQEVRTHLGVVTQRQWSKNAIA